MGWEPCFGCATALRTERKGYIMSYKLSSLCTEFTSRLASGAPTPGGGGAAALCGALSAALISMAGELSLGKKSTASHTDEITELNAAAKEKAARLLALIDADAAAFEPLSKAYSVPKDEPRRAEILSGASLTAAAAPMDILSVCLDTAKILERMAEICSRLMLSDVGCAASLCRAAAECAAMNVYVNLPGIIDGDIRCDMRARADCMLTSCSECSDAVAKTVLTKLRG